MEAVIHVKTQVLTTFRSACIHMFVAYLWDINREHKALLVAGPFWGHADGTIVPPSPLVLSPQSF